MNYQQRLKALITQGTISASQAQQFSKSLEYLTLRSEATPAKPASLLMVCGVILGLVVAGAMVTSLLASLWGPVAQETIQNVSGALNQQGATGNIGTSASAALTLFLLLSIPLATVLFFFAALYNRLVGYEQECDRTAQLIVNTLKAKQELTPRLREVAEAAMKYEETLQHSVAEARHPHAHALLKNLDDPEAPAAHTLGAIAEAYPQLKAQHSLDYLQGELSRLEDMLLLARNINAASLADFNRCARSVFGCCVARIYGFKTMLPAA